VDGVNVRDWNLAALRSQISMIEQDIFLFSRSIAENIAFGKPGAGREEIETAAKLAQADDFIQSFDKGYETVIGERGVTLSGGQRQRVALARALINHPKVLLLDEPLGALDLKLRQQMQVELKSIQQRVGITFIFVTHDQEEALTMSDRIALFNHGRIEQIGTPAEIYEHPTTAFVAGFVGTSNLVSGEVAKRITGSDITFSIRPEKIHLGGANESAPADSFVTDGSVRDVIYLGLYTRYLVELDGGGDLVVVEQNLKTTSMDVLKIKNQRVRLHWKKEHIRQVGG
jgi:putative spermidine/putrescine transport system ATP-binding protein